MPRRLLLDGEDLQSLMLRVREEMGPDARIIRAERIRTGGVAGFFARERYELTVEVPDVAPAPRARRRPAGSGRARTGGAVVPGPGGDEGAGGVGIEALLEAAEAAESAGSGGSAGSGDRTGADDAHSGTAPGPQVSTSSDTFAQVLQSMRLIVGEPEPEPAQRAEPAPERERGTDQELGSGTGAAAEPGLAAQSEGAGAADRAAEGPDGRGAEDATDRATDGDPEPAERPLMIPVRPSSPPPPGLEPERGGSSVNALLELGIPTRLLVGFADPRAAVPLSLLVRRFDPPPSVWLAPGRVVAVVGEGNEALSTARQMAHRAGTDPLDIVLAGEMDAVPGHGRRLQSPTAMRRYRSRVSPDAPAIVAIGVGPERADWLAAAILVAALEPSQSWAVLDARHKAVDLRRWLRAVGARRPFDAVAATSTFEAQAPGTVLNVGTPVGWVDGLPASPVVWAAVLSERLADDARWD